MRFKNTIAGCLLLLAVTANADTVDHYMNIANNIPQMEMKADPQSQAWARSAHTVLNLACDGIVDSLLLANATALQQGKPLFCLPPGTQISPETLDALIQQTYRELTTPQAEKDKMTVSQIALIGIQKQHPCDPQAAPTTQTPPQTATW